MTSKDFRTQCEKVADEVGVEVTFYDDNRRNTAFEDDGTLHVQMGCALRACFDVSNGQNLEGREQNENTRKVMEALKLPVTDRVLVDEDDDDEDEDDRFGRYDEDGDEDDDEDDEEDEDDEGGEDEDNEF